MLIDGRNVHQALPSVIEGILREGHGDYSRNGESREVLGATIYLQHPWERFSAVPGRHANPAALIAETFWVLAGRNDIKWLSYYLPRAEVFSDDGETWRAAYGPRLRKWDCIDDSYITEETSLDQLLAMVQLLTDDPNTRRAVMMIYNPTWDTGVVSKDIPCNDMVQFLARGHRLHTHVHVRSNDVMWGWSGINAFEWSMVSELVANSCGLEEGPITYFIGSLHLYDIHAQRAQKVATARTLYDSPYRNYPPTRFVASMATIDSLTAAFFAGEQTIRQDPFAIDRYNVVDELYRSELMPWLRAIDLYCRVTNHDVPLDDIVAKVNDLRQWHDIFWVMEEWWERQRETEARRRLNGLFTGNSALETIQSDPLSTLEDPTVLRNLRDLEAAKSVSYGTSWKKYGEMGSIFPNLARKYDRLANLHGRDTSGMEETIVDTIADLAVYAMKYYGYLKDPEIDSGINPALRDIQTFSTPLGDDNAMWEMIQDCFSQLERLLGFGVSHEGTANKDQTILLMALAAVTWLQILHEASDPSFDKFVQMVERLEAETRVHATPSDGKVH